MLPKFSFVPFSKKQRQVLTWWVPGKSPHANKDCIIADGSVRSGKTLIMSLSYVIWAMETFKFAKLGMAGKTIGSFRRNVLFLLKIVLRLRGYRVQDKRTDNLFVVSKKGVENYFYIFGGKDEKSQDLVQGFTSAGFFFDEVTLMPLSFVNQAVARCSEEGAKLWFNCNPEGPLHWFKLEWIDQLETKMALRIHFILGDNPSLSQKVKERYKRMFSGVFFKRYILGLWVVAEGIVYDMFDIDKHVVKELPANFERYYLGVDYGTTNPTVFLLFGEKYINGKHKLFVIDEYYYDSKATGRQKTDSEYSRDLQKFIVGRYPQSIVVDPSAASFILQLKRDGVKNIRQADNSVLDGIRVVANFFNNDRLFIHEKCNNFIMELATYSWDAKAIEHGEDKPLKVSDHACDACRYLLKTIFGREMFKAT